MKNRFKVLLIVLLMTLLGGLFACSAPSFNVTMNFIVDGETVQTEVLNESKMSPNFPENPQKEGYVFVYWQSDVPNYDGSNVFTKENAERGVYYYQCYSQETTFNLTAIFMEQDLVPQVDQALLPSVTVAHDGSFILGITTKATQLDINQVITVPNGVSVRYYFFNYITQSEVDVPDGVFDLEQYNGAYYIEVSKDGMSYSYMLQVNRPAYVYVEFEGLYNGKTVYVGDSIEIPDEIPTKDYYDFDGWDYDFSRVVTDQDAYIYVNAKWKARDYVYNFYTIDDNGQPQLLQSYTKNVETDGYNLYVDAPNIENFYHRRGYYAINWKEQSTGRTFYPGWSVDFEPSVSQYTYYLTYQTVSYQILYNNTYPDYEYANTNGLLNEYNIEYQGNDVVDGFYTPSALTLTHHDFLGWYLDNEFQTPATTVDLNARFSNTGVTESLTFYAKWKRTEYPVSYDLGIGEKDGVNPNPQTLTYYQGINLQQPYRAGCTFVGWYADANFNQEISSLNYKENEIIAYAKFEYIQYSIEYKSYYGDFTLSVENDWSVLPFNFNVDSQLNLAETLYDTKGVADFVGYYLDANYQQEFDESALSMADDLTIYLRWQPKVFTITYETNGLDMLDGGTYPTQFDFTDGYIYLSDLEKAGYLFDGWYENDKYVYCIAATIFPRNLTLTARKSIINYKLEIDGSDFNNSNPTTYTVEDEFEIQLPTKDWYYCSGLYTDQNLTNKIDLTIEKGTIGDIKLYPTWDIKDYNINYVFENGELPSDVITTFNINNASVVIKRPSIRNYIINGFKYAYANNPTNYQTSSNTYLNDLKPYDVTIEYLVESVFKTDGNAITGFKAGYEPNHIYEGEEFVTLTIPEYINNQKITSIKSLPLKSTQILKFENPDITFESRAFADSTSLLEVYLPDNLNSLAEGLFQNCKLLEKVHLGKNNAITQIPNYAFYDCNLSQALIFDGITTIGNYAFAYNNIEQVDLPSTLNTLGDCAFGANLFKNVTLPVIENLGYNVFDGDSIVSVTIPYRATAYNFTKNISSAPTVIFSAGVNVTIGGTASIDNLHYVIGDGAIINIGANFFKSSNLQSFVMGNNVTLTLGNNAFEDCKKLQAFSYGTNLNLQNIPSYCFRYCYNVVDFVIPSSVTKIGSSAFYNSKVSVGNLPNLTEIGTYAFYNTTIGSVDLSKSTALKTVKESAFNRATIENLHLAPSTVSYAKKAFFDSKINNLYVTNLVGLSTSTYASIDNSSPFKTCNKAYYNGAEFTEYLSPSGITTIPNYMLYGYKGLKTVVLAEGVITVGKGAFQETTVRSITLPSTLTTLGYLAFGDTPQVTEVINLSQLNNNNITDGDPALAYYNSATESHFVKDGDFEYFIDKEKGLYYISGYYGNAESLTLPLTVGGQSTFGIAPYAFYANKTIKTAHIPERVTEICRGAFSDSAVETVTLPDNITSIPKYCFSNVELGEFTIGNSITTISAYAFSGRIKKLIIGTGLKYVNANAFDGCYREVVCFDSIQTLLELDYGYAHNKNIISGYGDLYVEGKLIEGTLVIPDQYTKLGVSSLANQTKITKVVFGKGLTHLGKYCFNGTRMEIDFGDCEITTIGQYAFYEWFGTTMVLGEKVTAIQDYAFDTCSYLKSLTIPGKLTSLSSSWIDSGRHIESIYLSELDFFITHNSRVTVDNLYYNGQLITRYLTPYDTTYYTAKTFQGYQHLTEVVFNEGLESIGPETFMGCSNLTQITLPTTLKEIGTKAFYQTSLRQANFEDLVNLVGIYNEAFTYTKLTEVFLKNSTSLTTIRDAFSFIEKLKFIYLPDSLTEVPQGLSSSNIVGLTIIAPFEFEGENAKFTTVFWNETAVLVGGYVYDETAQYTVNFCDEEGNVLETVTVGALQKAEWTVEMPSKQGNGGTWYTFTGVWIDENGVEFNLNYVYKSVNLKPVYVISGV